MTSSYSNHLHTQRKHKFPQYVGTQSRKIANHKVAPHQPSKNRALKHNVFNLFQRTTQSFNIEPTMRRHTARKIVDPAIKLPTSIPNRSPPTRNLLSMFSQAPENLFPTRQMRNPTQHPNLRQVTHPAGKLRTIDN
jgi:hypothetical protein